jgi:hypothetical protein
MPPYGAEMIDAHRPLAAVPVPTGSTSTSVSNSSEKRAWSPSVHGSAP